MNFWNKIAARLKLGARVLSPTCRDASRLQSEALDGRLTMTQRWGLRLHLLLCKWCRRYGRQISFLRQAAHEHPDELTEASGKPLTAESRERIKRRLRAGK